MARTPLVDLLRRAAAIARMRAAPASRSTKRSRASAKLRIDHARRRFLRNRSARRPRSLLAACAPHAAAHARRRRGRHRRRRRRGTHLLRGACARPASRVRVYEAQERIGGRMFSLRNHFADGQVCELGGELIDTGHARMRALAAELGLVLDDLVAGSDRRVRRHLVLRRAPLQRAAKSCARSRRSPRRSRAMRTRLPDEQITYAAPGGAEALDRESMTQWLDRNGASRLAAHADRSRLHDRDGPRMRRAVRAQFPDLHRSRHRSVPDLRRERRALPRARRQRSDPACGSARSSAMRSRPAACSNRCARTRTAATR